MPMGQVGRVASAAVAVCGSALMMARDVALGTYATAIAGGLLILVGAAVGAREKIINARIATRKRESEARIELEHKEQEARIALEARETEARLAIEERTKGSLGAQLEAMRAELRKLNEKEHEARNRENLTALRHKDEVEQYEDHVKQLMDIIVGLRMDIERLQKHQAHGHREVLAGQQSTRVEMKQAIEGAVAATTGVIAEGLDKIAGVSPAAPPRSAGDEQGPSAPVDPG